MMISIAFIFIILISASHCTYHVLHSLIQLCFHIYSKEIKNACKKDIKLRLLVTVNVIYLSTFC